MAERHTKMIFKYHWAVYAAAAWQAYVAAIAAEAEPLEASAIAAARASEVDTSEDRDDG